MLKVFNFNASQYANITAKIHLLKYLQTYFTTFLSELCQICRKWVHIQINEIEFESSVLFQNLCWSIFPAATQPKFQPKYYTTTLVPYSTYSHHHVIYIWNLSIIHRIEFPLFFFHYPILAGG